MAAKKITKAHIVDSMYDQTGITRKEIRMMLDLFIDEIKTGLLQRNVIELRGFGTFELKVRKARPRSRNPRTGEIISIPPRGIVTFRAGRELKQEAWTIADEKPVKKK